MRVCEGLLRKRVDAGELLISGGIIDSRSPAVVEVYKQVGYDVVLVDREHSNLSLETVAEHIRVARCIGLPCMVRVAEDCYHELNRVLDQGADGIYVPRVRSREQVEQIVRTVRYPPDGIRGFAAGSCPIGKYAGWKSAAEQIEAVSKNTVIGIQIETAEALADLDGILSVEGVDVAVIGNDDLSAGIGIPGQTDSPRYQATVREVFAACRRHGVMPGIAVGDPDTALFWIKEGAKMIWYSCDIYLIYGSSVRELAQIRQGLV